MGDYLNRNRQGFDKEQETIVAQTVTTAVTGAGVKVGENVEINVMVKHNGTLGNADNTLICTIEESDDNSSFTTLQVMATLTAAVTKVVELVRTTKPYYRVKTGATAGTTATMGGVTAGLES